MAGMNRDEESHYFGNLEAWRREGDVFGGDFGEDVGEQENLLLPLLDGNVLEVLADEGEAVGLDFPR